MKNHLLIMKMIIITSWQIINSRMNMKNIIIKTSWLIISSRMNMKNIIKITSWLIQSSRMKIIIIQIIAQLTSMIVTMR
jgi:hypothetical protein